MPCHWLSAEKDNKYGTVTGRNCAGCSNVVHMLCCKRTLRIKIIDEDVKLHCSNCAISNGLYSSRKKASPNESDSTAGLDNTINWQAMKDVENSSTSRIFKRSGLQGHVYQVARKK